MRTFAHALLDAAAEQPDRLAFRFLGPDRAPQDRVTFGELAAYAGALAARLSAAGAPGDRVVLLANAGLDPCIGLYAVFLAGMVAVPVAAPHPSRIAHKSETMSRIAHDSGARIVLASPELFALRSEFARHDWRLVAPQWVPIGRDASHCATSPAEAPELALLQYTSGSTSAPKGVMLTHANLLANQAVIAEVTQATLRPDWGVSWLPHYHDMGLSFLLHAVLKRATCTFLSPLHFTQRPTDWLEALSFYGAGCTAAPSFALEHTLRRFDPARHPALDLSGLRALIVGAEPIPADALERFIAALAPFGLDPRAIYPSFGMAESTLMVTHQGYEPPQILPFDAERLSAGVAQRSEGVQPGSDALRLVGNGRAGELHRLRIVDPDSAAPLPDGQVGEIWVSGPSVGEGYWNNDIASQDTFGARTQPDDGAGYLRTGDLGFLLEGELFVVGRRKETIIIHGRNIYPHDVDEAIRSAADLQGCGIAVFRLEDATGPGLGILIEGRTRRDAAESSPAAAQLLRTLRAAVVNRFDVEVRHISWVPPFSLPRTTSGKIKRLACAALVTERRQEATA